MEHIKNLLTLLKNSKGKLFVMVVSSFVFLFFLFLKSQAIIFLLISVLSGVFPAQWIHYPAYSLSLWAFGDCVLLIAKKKNAFGVFFLG